MKDRVKELRLDIDKLASVTGEIQKTQNSEEVLNAQSSLFFAKAWLGKILGGLGNPSPYTKDGKRNSIEDIEPTAEKAHSVEPPEEFKEFNYVQKIDWMRQEIGKQVDKIEAMDFQGGRKQNLAKENVYTELCEARFWLGFELQRLRENG